MLFTFRAKESKEVQFDIYRLIINIINWFLIFNVKNFLYDICGTIWLILRIIVYYAVD